MNSIELVILFEKEFCLLETVETFLSNAEASHKEDFKLTLQSKNINNLFGRSITMNKNVANNINSKNYKKRRYFLQFKNNH